VDLDRLDILKERKDKLVSRLFMKKLEVLLAKDVTVQSRGDRAVTIQDHDAVIMVVFVLERHDGV
jgi:hypothetical protein